MIPGMLGKLLDLETIGGMAVVIKLLIDGIKMVFPELAGRKTVAVAFLLGVLLGLVVLPLMAGDKNISYALAVGAFLSGIIAAAGAIGLDVGLNALFRPDKVERANSGSSRLYIMLLCAGLGLLVASAPARAVPVELEPGVTVEVGFEPASGVWAEGDPETVVGQASVFTNTNLTATVVEAHSFRNYWWGKLIPLTWQRKKTISGVRNRPYVVGVPEGWSVVPGSLRINNVVQPDPVVQPGAFTVNLSLPAAAGATAPSVTTVSLQLKLANPTTNATTKVIYLGNSATAQAGPAWAISSDVRLISPAGGELVEEPATGVFDNGEFPITVMRWQQTSAKFSWRLASDP